MSDRFDCSIKRGHQIVLSNVVGRMQVGQVFMPTAQELADLGDLAGQLNKCAGVPTLPVQVLQQFRPGDPRFVFGATADVISAIPFVVAPGPYAVTSMIQAAAGEYGWGGTAFARAAINRQAGDLTGAQGGNSMIMVMRDAATDGAGLWYYNIVLDPGSQPRGTGFSVTFPR